MSSSNRRGFLKYMAGGLALAGTAGAGSLVEAQAANQQPLRIFLARRILTMDPNRPTATAVAVENGRIVAVGSLPEVRAALGGRDAEIDPTFANQVILPGFVEAHCHIQEYGFVAGLPYVGYFDRPAPDGGKLTAARSLDDMIARLRAAVREQVARTGNPNQPLFAFGADPIYFGGQHFTTEILDRASTETPIFLQLVSGHIICCNSPMLALVEQSPGWPLIANTNAVIR
ncbi:MAG: imidazolonepropionase-like domain-containing protein, partial [Dehalococcoidia bacterium]